MRENEATRAALKTLGVYENDLALVTYAAFAFNHGFTSSRVREQHAVNRLERACRRVGAVVGIEPSEMAEYLPEDDDDGAPA